MNQSFTDTSMDDEPSLLAGLDEDQRARLTQCLDDYLISLENGKSPNKEEIVLENPDISEVFNAYLEKLDALYGIAVGVSGSSQEESLGQIVSGKIQLGDFTIQREIGRGGMGVVYEARQESLSRQVAIKLLPLASLLDSKQIERFKNEAHIAGLLNHPNIVPVHSVGSQRGLHYYAMQLIDGVSMDDWLSAARALVEDASSEDGLRNARPSWRKTLGWMIDVARALHAAHEAGIVHRDVKPSNLMLDKQGKIWITDFGLARCQTDVSVTKSGDLVGTMRYMSPEQARGQHALVDGRTDVYSLAATAYELLTLQAVHDGTDGPTIMRMIAEQDVKRLRQQSRVLPRDLETVIAKAMSKSRDDRYETAEAFADDLARVLAGEPTIARPPTIVDRLGRFASKHRLGVLWGVLVGLLGLVGFATSTAIIATWKQASDENAVRATRNEQLARGAVDRLGSQMAELLVDIPSADPVRQTLLTETLSYYQMFAASADDDPALKEDLATTFGKIGALQGELGETEKAINALRRSESLYAELVQDDQTLQLDWSISQNNLAQALSAKGKLEEAATYFSRAINLQRRIVAECYAARTDKHFDAQQSKEARSQLATTLNNLGLLLADSLVVEEAEKSYLEAIALLQPRGQSPSDTGTKQQLAAILANLSGLLARESPLRAIDYARQALTQQTDALETESGNAKIATKVVVTLNTLGASQSAAGHPREAIETLSRAVGIGNQLLTRWPGQRTHQRDLVVSFNHLGLAYSKTGNLRQATQAFEDALTHGRPLARAFADDAETQSMLGGVLNNLGFLQQQQGKRESAAATYEEAIAAQSLAVRLAPEVKRYREYLRKHQENQRAVTGVSKAS